ncbi:MAG: KamA family radical SAM protein [Candidatus Omnitrophica bacterium]|nr:KamA family radical SAM protein [Candidatus Omnitrophota bacterium]
MPQGSSQGSSVEPNNDPEEPPGLGQRLRSPKVQSLPRNPAVFSFRRVSLVSGAGSPPASRRKAVSWLDSCKRSRGSSIQSALFRKRFFPEAGLAEWNDWRWQMRNRIRTLEGLEQIFTLSESERRVLVERGSMLPLGITPYYAAHLHREDPDDPLRLTVIPREAESLRAPGESDDPLGEDNYSPVPGLVHRYPDRVLLLAHDVCSTYCRYCTRSRMVGHGQISAGQDRLEQACRYIENNPQIRDVLLSGGDPLCLSDDRLESILSRLRQIPHVEFIRLGTKIPAVLPQRITSDLCAMLRRYHPLWMSLHFTHPGECTPESFRACSRLADAGIPLGSQTVLLRGVNNSVPVMKELMHRLLMMRVRPYYLYQCDPISGSSHFRTSVEEGLEIIKGLRGHTTGYAVPTFVIDAPGGGGKIPLQPNYVLDRDRGVLRLQNYEGRTFCYPDQLSDGGLV